MRIFVAGATGAVGRRLVPRLIGRGHSVTALTRTPAKAALLRELRAEPVDADVLDHRAIHAVIDTAHPDVIVHVAHRSRGRAGPAQVRPCICQDQPTAHHWNRQPACRRGRGVKRFVAQSYCGWPYVRSTSGRVSPSTTRSIRNRRRSSDGLSKLFAIWKTPSPRLRSRHASCCVQVASTVTGLW
jgi:nucleoside-diphosphate-sugar epimerase